MSLDYGMILNQPSVGSQLQQGIGQFLGIREMEAQAKMREQAQMQDQQQAERQGMFQQAFGQAFQSGDRQQLAALMGQFPDQYEQIKGALGFQDEQRAAALGSLGVQLSTLAAQDPNAAAQLIAQNAEVLRQAGPGYEPEGLLQTLQQDPAALADRADKFSLLALGPEKYFDVMGNRAKIDAQLSGQSVQMRAQNIQLQEGKENRANALTLKQLTLSDKVLDRQVSMLGKQLDNETNDLRRQELQLKLEEKRGQLEQNRKELGDKQQTTITNMTEAARLATELVDDPNLGNAVGTVGTMIPTLSGQTQDVINKANRLQSLLTVDNLKLMTGVLTDRDIAFLTNVASGLNVVDGGIKGSEREVKKRLGEISTKMSEKLAKFQPQPTMPNPNAQSAPADVDALLNKYAPR
jgi:hypothetical protein